MRGCRGAAADPACGREILERLRGFLPGLGESFGGSRVPPHQRRPCAILPPAKELIPPQNEIILP